MTKKVEVIMSPRVGRGYSTTTAHGTKAGGFLRDPLILYMKNI